MKQGPLGGILKELGYTEDQVGNAWSCTSALKTDCAAGIQVLSECDKYGLQCCYNVV